MHVYALQELKQLRWCTYCTFGIVWKLVISFSIDMLKMDQIVLHSVFKMCRLFVQLLYKLIAFIIWVCGNKTSQNMTFLEQKVLFRGKNTHQTEQKNEWKHISRDTLLKTEISPTFYSPLCRWRTWWHFFLFTLFSQKERISTQCDNDDSIK